jgi:peptidoglycan/LPS O-acetylase OafA/YrhL
MFMCLLAVPAIIALFGHTRTYRLDFFLGELSFPIYLIHYAFVSTLVHTQVAMPFGLSTFSVVLGLTITTALVLNYLVQIPLDKWRHNSFLYK